MRSSAASDVYKRQLFNVYLYFAGLMTAVMLVVFIVLLVGVRGKNDYEKYTALERLRTPYLAMSFLGLGLPLVAAVPLVGLLRRWRDRKRRCPNCSASMVKIDEVHDNDFLTPAQDAEERMQSVDYDVWHCPSCGYDEILPYVNKSAPFIECEACRARTARYEGNHVLRQPTTGREGLGERSYRCLHCGHITKRTYNIAKLAPIVLSLIHI